MRILAPRSPDPHLVSLESAVLEAQQIQCSSSADSPILSTDAVRKEDLDQLKELLEVDVRALVLAEKTIQGALATPDSSSSCEVYGGRRVEVSAQRLQVIDDADTPHVSTGLDVTVAINDTTEGREEESPCQFLRTRLLIDDDLKPDSNAS
ncbi:hypothetical protein BC832DRAFT_293460 [Gaertneriomyces semiglobifer]|nr:hypothetical protein BC832DRAFT_293460 [Gaertneriomyces semiglobifer]